MPIREESFRIGCGRYIQGRGYVSKVGEEICRLGKSPLVIGSRKALEAAGGGLKKSISEYCSKYEIIVHTGTCCEEYAKDIAKIAGSKGYDIIVGVGGGVICDFAKLCGHFAALPVITVPTSSATCACYTPLSVRYTPDGRTVGTLHYTTEVDCVIADTDILAAQPIRLLLAGVFDALAKFVEIKHRFSEDCNDYPLGLDYAYAMSKYSFGLLTRTIEKCISDMKNGIISEDVERVIFTSLAATGVISGIARGSNQTALAHKFYENVRFLYPDVTKPYIHGEIVGIGLLLQNHYNGEEANNELVFSLMKRYGLPHCVGDIGIAADSASFDAVYERLCRCSAMEGASDAEFLKLRRSLEYLWSIS